MGLGAEFLGGGAVHFGGHRAAADAGGVGFEDAHHAGDVLGADAESGDGAADGGGGGGYIGIGAVVEVQEGALGAFQDDAFVLFQEVLHHLFGGAHAGAEAGGPLAALFQDGGGVQGLGVVDGGDDAVFHCHGGVDAVGEVVVVEEVAHTDAVAGGFVHIGGADALSGGADGGGAAGLFLEVVQEDVVGHNDVGAVADEEVVGVDALLLEGGDFGEEDIGVDDDAVADDAGDAGPADAGGDEVQLEFAPVVDDGVAGVVAAGVAHYAIGLSGKVVDDLALALVAPLPSDNGVSRHCSLCSWKIAGLTRKLAPAGSRCGLRRGWPSARGGARRCGGRGIIAEKGAA